jgi:hypothetical protein
VLHSPAIFAAHFGALALVLGGVFALGRLAANASVAAATTLCVALHPAFLPPAFSPSIDSAAVLFPTALVVWGLFFLFSRPAGSAGVVDAGSGRSLRRRARAALAFSLLLAAVLLIAVRAADYGPARGTGGAEVGAADFDAAAYFAGVWGHLKHLTTSGGMWALTLSGLAAMLLRPRRDAGAERPRIRVPVQLTFAAVAAAHAALLPFFGATGLADALPVLPPIILVWVSTLWRRVPLWPLAVALVCAAFALHIG